MIQSGLKQRFIIKRDVHHQAGSVGHLLRHLLRHLLLSQGRGWTEGHVAFPSTFSWLGSSCFRIPAFLPFNPVLFASRLYFGFGKYVFLCFSKSLGREKQTQFPHSPSSASVWDRDRLFVFQSNRRAISTTVLIYFSSQQAFPARDLGTGKVQAKCIFND